MHLIQIKSSSTGRTYLALAKSFRDPETGKPRQAIVEKLGYLDQLEGTYSDPIAHFKEEARLRTLKEKSEESSFTLRINASDRKDQRSKKICLGLAPLLKVYHELGIDSLITSRSRSWEADTNLNATVRQLVFQRLLQGSVFPFARKDNCNSCFDLSEHRTNEALPFLLSARTNILEHLNSVMQNQLGRKGQILYCYTLSFYFEFDPTDPDSEYYNHRKGGTNNPGIEMSLFMDSLGYPVTYALRQGTRNDYSSYKPIESSQRDQFNVHDFIFIAKREAYTDDIVHRCIEKSRGYIVSQSLRRANDRFIEFAEDPSGYGDLGSQARYKEACFPRRITYKDDSGLWHDTVVNERQIILWRLSDAGREQRSRRFSGEQSSGWSIDEGIDASNVIHHCSEEAENEINLHLGRYNARSSLDGYTVICTNVIGLSRKERPFGKRCRFRDDNMFQVNEDMPARKIICRYMELGNVYSMFKHDHEDLNLDSDVFIWNQNLIKAHFLVSFIAFLVLRVIQNDVCKQEFKLKEISDALTRASGFQLPQGWYYFDYDDCNGILKTIGNRFGIDFGKLIRSPADLRKLFSNMKR